MGRLDFDQIPDKRPRRMADLFALLEPDDRAMVLDAVQSDSKDVTLLRDAIQGAYPELPEYELKTWKNWAANYRQGRTVG